VAMTTFMISLGGIPPTAGFWAKLVVFRVAIEAGGVGPWLAVFMLVNSVVSIYYYLAIPRQMFLQPALEERSPIVPALLTGVIMLATLAVVAIGFYPDLLYRFPPGSTLLGVGG
jgi:NADH:ubiquinone oxidoreductase subunit 2 (subunit N)